MAHAVRGHDLTKRYRTRGRSGSRTITALDGVTLDIEPGSWTALLGPNGSGKSTLLKILATLIECDAGRVEWFGDQSRGLSAIRRSIGVVFQSPAVDPLLTPSELLGVQSALVGCKHDASKRIAELADDFGFADRLDDRIGTLSGGLVRRVDLARALLHEPELILLDEPTTGLDHEARSEFLDLIDRWRARSPQLSVVFSTHLMDEAERADRVVMMSAGSIVADGPPETLRRSAGAFVVRTDEADLDRLHTLDLEPVLREGHAEAVLANDGGTAERVASELASEGVGFAMTRPTLGDVYLRATGTRLDNAGKGQP